MARLPVVSADMVPAEFRAAFDEVVAPSGGSITGGPGSCTINSPEMAQRRQHRCWGHRTGQIGRPTRRPRPGHAPR